MSKNRPNKFKDKNSIHVNGKFYELGGSEEILVNIKWQWFKYLERVFNNPSLPNPFENTSNPEVYLLLKEEGIVGLSQEEIFKAAEKYMDDVGSGKIEPYTDKLHHVQWLDKETKTWSEPRRI